MTEKEFLAQKYAFAVYGVESTAMASMLPEPDPKTIEERNYKFMYAFFDWNLRYTGINCKCTTDNYPLSKYLNNIFKESNVTNIAWGYKSISVGDVIALNHEGKIYAYIVMPMGFAYLPQWKGSKHFGEYVSNDNVKSIRTLLSEMSNAADTAMRIRSGAITAPSGLTITMQYPYYITARISPVEYRVCVLSYNNTTFNVNTAAKFDSDDDWLVLRGMTEDDYEIVCRIKITPDEDVFDYSSLKVFYYYKSGEKAEYKGDQIENLFNEFIYQIAGTVKLRHNNNTKTYEVNNADDSD